MSASARATARIARAMPSAHPAAGLVADRAELPRRHPDLARQVGLAHARAAPNVAGQAPQAGRRTPRSPAPARCRRPAPSAAPRAPVDVAPQKAASATANDFASARPPKYRLTFSVVSGSPGKSLASWSAAADSDAEVLADGLDQEAARRRCSMRHRAARTSATTKPGYSAARQRHGLHLGHAPQLAQLGQHAAALLARRRAPAPARRPRPARRRSRAGRRRTPRAGSPAPRTTTQRVVENSDGAASSPSWPCVSRSAGGLGELGLGVVARTACGPPGRRCARRGTPPCRSPG